MGEFKAPLPQGAGYAIILGLGYVFAFGMILTTYILKRYQKEILTAEEFATAGRSVKKFLIASATVSSWTWLSTLLNSSSEAYRVGVSGGYYYGAGAVVQLFSVSIIVNKLKLIAPNSHTYLEVLKIRFGKWGHSVFIFYAFATNIVVTAMLLTGASSAFVSLTGMNMIAACFLLPLGVVTYTIFGGLKSTFLTDYVHTIAILIIILTFAFKVYATSDVLGSIDLVYDRLRELAKSYPISGNKGGEYLTLKSRSGGIFFFINFVGNHATVFLDNGYISKALATRSTLSGFILAGVSWIEIPLLMASTMGLACLVLEGDYRFPTYPDRLTDDQVTAGLVVPAAAVTIMGKGGAVATVFMAFMACTSAMSAELVSFSSVVTYDVYRAYINPKATGKQLIFCSHVSCVVFGVCMSGFAVGLYYGNISMGYLYEMMGVVLSGAVLPMSVSLFWKDLNTVAAAVSPVLSMGLAIMGWLVCTYKEYIHITVPATFEDYPMLVGNVVAFLGPLIFMPILTYAFGKQNFDWERLKYEIKRADETEEILEAEGINIDDEEHNLYKIDNNSENTSIEKGQEVKTKADELIPVNTVVSAINSGISKEEMKKELSEEEKVLRKNLRYSMYITIFVSLAFLIVWPMPMYGSGYIFSKKFFRGWIIIMIIWLFIGAFIVVLGPLIESRDAIYTTLRGIYWDLSGQTYKLREWQESNPEKLHVVQSQISAKIHNVQEMDQVLEDSV